MTDAPDHRRARELSDAPRDVDERAQDTAPERTPGHDEVEAAMVASARALDERRERAHELVACPRCGAPVGERCWSMPRGRRARTSGGYPLEHPHRERARRVAPDR